MREAQGLCKVCCRNESEKGEAQGCLEAPAVVDTGSTRWEAGVLESSGCFTPLQGSEKAILYIPLPEKDSALKKHRPLCREHTGLPSLESAWAGDTH